MSSESLRLPLPVCGRAGANWVGGQVGLAQQTSYVSKLRCLGLENIITVPRAALGPIHGLIGRSHMETCRPICVL